MSRSVRVFLCVLLVLVPAVVLAGCGGSRGESDSAGDQTAPQGEGQGVAPEETPPPPTPETIGEKVTSAEWDLVVLGASVEQAAGGATAPAGKSLLLVEFELTNTAGRPRAIGQVDFELTDTSDGQYAVVPTSGEDFIFNTPQPIEAGETRTIGIVYEIPAEGAQGLILRFEPFVEGGASEPVAVSLD